MQKVLLKNCSGPGAMGGLEMEQSKANLFSVLEGLNTWEDRYSASNCNKVCSVYTKVPDAVST